MSQINEPFCGYVHCNLCKHVWITLLPEGCEDSVLIRCPKCRKAGGAVFDVDPVDSKPEIAPKTCDCFNCSGYCKCACHDQDPQDITDEDRMDTFDHIFDLVMQKKSVMRADLVALGLDPNEVAKMAPFFENHSYYPDDVGVHYDPKRGAA